MLALVSIAIKSHFRRRAEKLGGAARKNLAATPQKSGPCLSAEPIQNLAGV